MYHLLLPITLALVFATPILYRKKAFPLRYLKTASIAKIGAVFLLCAIVVVAGFAGRADAAAESAAASDGFATGVGYIAAALSTGMACIGAGIAVAASASAAIGASAEDPSMMGRVLIFVAMGEGVTLFGLLVSIMILGRL